jgi:hypothetical protein
MRGGGVVSRSTRAAPAPIVSERSISLQAETWKRCEEFDLTETFKYGMGYTSTP